MESKPLDRRRNYSAIDSVIRGSKIRFAQSHIKHDIKPIFCFITLGTYILRQQLKFFDNSLFRKVILGS